MCANDFREYLRAFLRFKKQAASGGGAPIAAYSLVAGVYARSRGGRREVTVLSLDDYLEIELTLRRELGIVRKGHTHGR